MKYAIIIIPFIFLSLSSFGQRMPFFMHHVTNPYLYNPAFAGYDKHTVFYLTHREQWLGVEGAPSSTSLIFHTPGGQANPISYGADISNDRIGIVNNTNVRATVAYLVPFGVEKEHYLRFGIAAGVFSQNFDLTDVDIEDDVVLQRVFNRSTSLDGRAGIQYHLDKLNLGFALPNLFGTSAIQVGGTPLGGTPPDGSKTITALDRMIASANYSITLSPDGSLSLDPTITYHISAESGNQLSAFGVLNIKDVFWAGGGYQQQEGIGGIIGFKAKNLKIGYAYGFGGNALAGQSGGTHEAQIALQIGKKQEIVKRKPRLSTTVNGEKIPEAAILAAKKEQEKKERKNKRKKKEEETVPDRKRVNPVAQSTKPASEIQKPAEPAEKVEERKQVAQKPQPTNYEDLQFESLEKNKNGVAKLKAAQTKPDTQPAEGNTTKADDKTAVEEESKIVKITTSKKDVHPLAIDVGKYIVVGTFSQESNARNFMKQLIAEGYDANIGYHAEKNFYYTHIMRSSDIEFLKGKLKELKRKTNYKSAWILSVEE